jgi:hypothetical protein
MSDLKKKKEKEAMKMKKTLKTGIYSPLGAKKMSAKEKAEFKAKFAKAKAGKQAMKAEKTVSTTPKYKAVKTIKEGLHKMPDGTIMKDSDMKFKKTLKRLKKS